MPGIINHQSLERLDIGKQQHGFSIASLPSPRISSSTYNVGASIAYVPPQTDPLSSTSTRAVRQSPMQIFLRDTGVLFRMLPYFPWMFLPCRSSDNKAELYLTRQNSKDMLLLGVLFFYELALIFLSIPVLLILPGSVSMTLAGVSAAIIHCIAWPLEGPSIIHSAMDGSTRTSAEQHKDERWLFINGCASSHSILQANIDRVSQIFGRAVLGIHNKTYGLIVDVIECLIQRVFSYNTTAVRVTYEQIKAVLCDPTVLKVVVIGHSQGGLIISLVLDHLFDELPSSAMAKLEVYTFGSAASHFSNPQLVLDPVSLHANEERVIPHIEQYGPPSNAHCILLKSS